MIVFISLKVYPSFVSPITGGWTVSPPGKRYAEVLTSDNCGGDLVWSHRTVFQASRTISHPHQQGMRLPVSPEPQPHDHPSFWLKHPNGWEVRLTGVGTPSNAEGSGGSTLNALPHVIGNLINHCSRLFFPSPKGLPR